MARFAKADICLQCILMILGSGTHTAMLDLELSSIHWRARKDASVEGWF